MPSRDDWTVVHGNHAGQALGETHPKNLSFNIFLGRKGGTTYDLDLSEALAVKANTNPYITTYTIYRSKTPVASGEHTQVSIGNEEEGILKVAGEDYLGYLEQRQYPFDPLNPLANTYLVTARDLALIVKDILTTVQAQTNSMTFDLSQLVAIGQTTNYKIDPGDTEDILAKITALSKRSPGFDFDVSVVGRIIRIYYPKKGGNTGIVLEQGSNIYEVDYTDAGIVATHTLGTASANSLKLGVALDSTNQPQYYRRDATIDFSDVTDTVLLSNLAQGESERNSTPHLQISCKVIKDSLDIWRSVSIGDNVRFAADMKYDVIDRTLRVVGMECNVDDEGDEEWSLTLDDGTLSL